MGLGKMRACQAIVLLAFAAAPAIVCQYSAQPPQDRHIHIDSFRYGKDPSAIYVNRGDRLHLTFSSLDTGHSFFLDEFDIDAKMSAGDDRVQVFSTSDPTRPAPVQREVVLEARRPGIANWLASKAVFRDHVWTGPMHAFEQGKLIIRPNTLLFASMGALLGLPLALLIGAWPMLVSTAPAHLPRPASVDLLKRDGWLRQLLRGRALLFYLQMFALLLLYGVLLTTLFGTKVAGRNMGSMLLWVLWLFMLATLMVPLAGKIWCAVCPLPLFGEWMQRGAISGVRQGKTNGTHNRFFGLNLKWPAALSSAWPRTILFLILGTFSVPIVAVPRVTGLVLLGMLLLATVMALIWELRAFCRYICPINSFIGLYAGGGKLALRAADADVCQRCKAESCLSGNKRGWACPYGLSVKHLNDNSECGLCTECLKTCPHDNVTLLLRPFARDAAIADTPQAFLAIVMFVMAIAYSIVHLGHWSALRDWVNILDKGNWGPFGVYTAVVWVLCLGVVPGLIWLAAALGRRLARPMQITSRQIAVQSTVALVPLGLMLWIAFVIPMLLVNATFLIQSLNDPFGWGWDLFGAANTPWRPIWPGGIPWLQAVCVLAGLGYALRRLWHAWLRFAPGPRPALLGMLPLSIALVAIAGWMLWFFVN